MNKPWQLISDDSAWMFRPDIWLSTIELIGNVYRDTPYESCIFYSNGDSDIVARYRTKEEALEGHIFLEKKYKLKRCLKLTI